MNGRFIEGLGSASVKNTILHDVYHKIDKALNSMLDIYKNNNFKELRLILDNNNYFKLSEAKSVLILLLLGNKYIINGCFKIIIDIISSKDDELNDRTQIMFKIADRLVKLVKLGLSKLDSIDSDSDNDNDRDSVNKHVFKIMDVNNKEVKRILKLWNVNRLTHIINSLDHKDKSILGDTVLRLILDKCDLIKEK